MSDRNRRRLNKRLPIVMSKDITQARFSMNLWERRLMYVCLSKISDADIDFKEIGFSVSEMCSILEDMSLMGGKTQSLILRAGSEIAKRQVYAKEGSVHTFIPWFEYFTFDEKKQYIKMKFNERMKPHLLFALNNKGYTKFLLTYAMPLSSVYAQRFYEMFRGLVYEGNCYAVQRVDLQELRDRLEMDRDSYKKYGMFKKSVLDLAARDINKKTEINISFTEIRGNTRGRPVVAVNVSVALKAGMSEEWHKLLLRDKAEIISLLAQTTSQRFNQLIDIKEIEAFDHARIAKLTYQVISRELDLSNIKNFNGFYKYWLANDDNFSDCN